jgi:hypothetical protein
MPAVYDGLGIRFQYSENWSLDESEALAGEPMVTVYAPGASASGAAASGAFWSLTVHDRCDPAQLVNEAVQALGDEYGDVESEPADETILGQPVSGQNLGFFYLDMTITALVRAIVGRSAVYLVLAQAEDRDLPQVRAVFQAMTTSLVMELQAIEKVGKEN